MPLPFGWWEDPLPLNDELAELRRWWVELPLVFVVFVVPSVGAQACPTTVRSVSRGTATGVRDCEGQKSVALVVLGK